LARAPPQTPLGSLQRSPDPLAGLKGGYFYKGRGGEEWGKGRERKERGMEVGEGKGGREKRRDRVPK